MYMTSTYKYIDIEEIWYMIYEHRPWTWNISWLINMTALPHLGIKNFQEPVCSLYILSMVTTPLSIFSTKKSWSASMYNFTFGLFSIQQVWWWSLMIPINFYIFGGVSQPLNNFLVPWWYVFTKHCKICAVFSCFQITHLHTYTHAHINPYPYIILYIYICICVFV